MALVTMLDEYRSDLRFKERELSGVVLGVPVPGVRDVRADRQQYSQAECKNSIP